MLVGVTCVGKQQKAVAYCIFANGISMRTPDIVCPGFRSSERIRLAPLLIAASR
jgi:hypothetical protein